MTDGEKIVYRHEFKYFISSAELGILKYRIGAVMQRDPHAGEEGRYNVRSLYFDDCRDRCFYDNENGVDPRAKYRIRIYDRSADFISLELKIKENGMTRKLSCRLTKEEAGRLMEGKCPDALSGRPRIIQGLCADMLTNGMRPKIIVDYDRYPFVYRDGNVRVTFDTSVSSSADVASFFDGTVAKRPVLPAGLQLLEVKYDEFLPDVIYRALGLDDLRRTAFSKYYLCRKYSIK